VAAQNETKPIKNVSLHPKTKIRWSAGWGFWWRREVQQGEAYALRKMQPFGVDF